MNRLDTFDLAIVINSGLSILSIIIVNIMYLRSKNTQISSGYKLII